jgi:hypothetical protein
MKEVCNATVLQCDGQPHQFGVLAAKLRGVMVPTAHPRGVPAAKLRGVLLAYRWGANVKIPHL